MGDNLKIIKLASYTSPKVSEKPKNAWVEYGEDNNFYQYLIDLFHSSPTNNAAIQGISDLIYGEGMEAAEGSSLEAYVNFIKIFQPEDVRRVCHDLKLFGHASFQLTLDKGQVVGAFHIPRNYLRPAKVNDEGEVDTFYFSNDWSKAKSPKFKPQAFPAFGHQGDGDDVAILSVESYSPGSVYFSPVDYQGGLQYAELEGEIANYHLNNIKNGLAPSMMINFNNGVPPIEEQFEIERDILAKWGGSSNSGKAIIAFKVESRWDRLFVEDSAIDWRMVSWGGVLIDDREYDTTDAPCNCIPAADNPRTTGVAEGDEWLDDDTIVFGVVINDEARAYPRSIMEVREMVNDTLGGRDIAMPYCTLCGSAQVYFTDQVPEGIERPILRTSGLLTRSNKVMYDVRTFSIFDTFLGQAVSGPLFEAGIELEQNSVITTTWGKWKAEHPDTTVLHIAEALGRPDSDLRNTRDAAGPIFPIGDVDPRLPVQEDVLGLLTESGDPIAFHVASAMNALERGETIAVDGINLVLDGGGVKAVDDDGNDLGGHQAFWFAWSQFHADTELWPAE